MGWLRWQGLLLTFIAAAYWPLTVLAVNLGNVTRPERVAFIVGTAWSIGVILIGLLYACGMPVVPAENTSFITLVLLMSAGTMMRRIGDLALVLVVAVAVMAGVLFVRTQGFWLISGVIWGTAVAIAVGPLSAMLPSGVETATLPQSASPALPIEMVEKPDVFLVVFDGYPGLNATELDAVEPGEVDARSELTARGFNVPTSSWTSYWLTVLSIPSLLEMGFPIVEGTWTGDENAAGAAHVLSGDNALVETLKANGYVVNMVEPGWSHSHCGPAIDVCKASPWLDESTFLTLRHTAAWAMLRNDPGPFTSGALAAFDWLLANGNSLSSSPEPDFVYAHVIAPHPPFFMTSDCSVQVSLERGGTVFDLEGVPPELRDEYLIQQMDCVDRFMVDFADVIDPDDVVIFVSDHGTDRRGQTVSEALVWDIDELVERMSNFLAVRLPNDCEIEDRIVLPNVMRSTLSCLTAAPIPLLEERMFIYPMAELDDATVSSLLELTAEPER